MHPLDEFADPASILLGVPLAASVLWAFVRAGLDEYRERQLARPGRRWRARMDTLGTVTRGDLP